MAMTRDGTRKRRTNLREMSIRELVADRTIYKGVLDYASQLSWRYLGRRDGAEDVAHTAIQKALAHEPDFRPASEVTAWLRQIVKRLILDEWRRVRRTQRCYARCGPPHIFKESAEPDLSGDSIAINEVLKRLRPSHRRTLTIRYLEGLDYQALADRLGLPSIEAARNRVSRALKAAREVVARLGIGDVAYRTDGRLKIVVPSA